MNVISWNVVVVVVPVSTMTTLLPLVPVFKPSSVQLPEALLTAHSILTAFVIHSDAAPEIELLVHDAPVYAVADGVR